MEWNYYREWCNRTGKPCLVIPHGINGIDEDKWEDGIYYRNGKEMGPYMVIYNYASHHVLVRFREINNIHRFEAHRWTVLTHLKKLQERMDELTVLINEFADESDLIGPHKDEWYRLKVSEGSVDSKKFDMKALEVLDQIVATTGSDREQELVYSYVMTSKRIEKYYRRASVIDKCMCDLIREVHPHRLKPWVSKPADFVINGRRYLVTQPAAIDRCADYWPSPMTETIDLDSIDQQLSAGQLIYRAV